jgi:hypothetical protein
MLWCVPVHRSFEYSLHFMLGGPGIIRHPIEVCQDWNPTVTVARQDFRKCAYAPMHLIMEYLCVPYAWHAWLQQPHLWVCSQTFCSPRCENTLSLRKTLSWVHGVFLFTMMWPFGNIFHGSHGARWFLVPKLFRENPLLLPCVWCIMASTYWRANRESNSRKCLLIHGLVVCIARY